MCRGYRAIQATIQATVYVGNDPEVIENAYTGPAIAKATLLSNIHECSRPVYAFFR
jgi:hypothetical protein